MSPSLRVRVVVWTGWRVLRRIIRTPLGTILLFTSFLLDACSLPRGSFAGAVTSIVSGGCGCGRSRPLIAHVVQTQAGLQVIDRYSDEADDIAADAIVSTVLCWVRPRHTGFWAVTREKRNPQVIECCPNARPLTAEEWPTVRFAVAELVRQWDPTTPSEYLQAVRSGGDPLTRVLWSGYVHNVMAASLFILLCASLGWVRDRRIAARGARRLALGHCPQCDYDLMTTPCHCPECGWRRAGLIAENHSRETPD